MKKVIVLCSTCALLASFALAQDKGDLGINFRIDPQPRIGATIHLSSRLALRPYVGFSFGRTEADSEFEALGDLGLVVGQREEESTSLNMGLGLFYYFHLKRDFSSYTGINFNYARETLETTITSDRPLRPNIERKTEDAGNVYQTSFLIGLQGRLMKNLSIFGEVGFGYTLGKFEHEDRVELRSTFTRWGLANSGLGLIFYF
ncbi:MAG: autotransporter outer membrane beta-barrel domain-containing protein [Acidobacteriota bacterium]